MAKAKTEPKPVDRKVIRKETFKLSDNDKFILQQLSHQISLAQQQFNLGQQQYNLAQNNVTNYLGIQAIERWDFPRNADVRFGDFSLEDGKVTVEQLEPLDDPKDQAGGEQPKSSKTGEESENKASEKTEGDQGEEPDTAGSDDPATEA